MGLAGLSRLAMEVQGRHSDRLRARLSGAAGQFHGSAAVPAQSGGRAGADDSAGRTCCGPPGSSVKPSTKAATGPATTSRPISPPNTARQAVHRQARLLGPGRAMQRRQARLDERHRRLSQRRRRLHRLHHARLSRQVHAVPGRAARGQALDHGRQSCTAGRCGLCDASPGLDQPRTGMASANEYHKLPITGINDRETTRARAAVAEPSRKLHHWHGRKDVMAPQLDRNVLGPDHAHRRQPGHPHQDRLRQSPGRRVPQHLVDLSRLQRLHEGQGSARRPLHHQPHLRHLRRQPRHLRLLRPEHGLRHQAARHWPSGSSTSARRPSTCSTTISIRTIWSASISASRWSRKPIPRVLARAEKTLAPHGDLHGYRTIADIMRAPQSVHRRVLPRSPAHEPADARNVLPDGRPARPSLDALSRRRRHRPVRAALHRLSRPADEVRRVHEKGRAAARRPVRLLLRGLARLRGGRPAARAARLLGLLQQSRRRAITPTSTWRTGAGRCTSRPASSSTASW